MEFPYNMQISKLSTLTKYYTITPMFYAMRNIKKAKTVRHMINYGLPFLL